jgi:hypothetical protein
LKVERNFPGRVHAVIPGPSDYPKRERDRLLRQTAASFDDADTRDSHSLEADAERTEHDAHLLQ